MSTHRTPTLTLALVLIYPRTPAFYTISHTRFAHKQDILEVIMKLDTEQLRSTRVRHHGRKLCSTTITINNKVEASFSDQENLSLPCSSGTYQKSLPFLPKVLQCHLPSPIRVVPSFRHCGRSQPLANIALSRLAPGKDSTLPCRDAVQTVVTPMSLSRRICGHGVAGAMPVVFRVGSLAAQARP